MAGVAESVWGFIEAACVPRDRAHSSGTLDGAEAILAEEPEMASRSVYAASVLGDDLEVRRFIELDPANATVKGGPYEWDALTYLCFSRYLRLDASRSHGFVRAARALLGAGANANTGWLERSGNSESVWESALYGAAGVAHNAPLTRVLIEHGADPNDDEVPYHSPETHDNDALKVIVESGRLTDDNLATMLLRKTDWHDYEGIELLLGHGADPNRETRWGRTALHHAALRDNSIEIFELLLENGADPALLMPAHGISATAIAARRGRADVLVLLRRRGFSVELNGADRLIAACAMSDRSLIRDLASMEPQLVRDVIAMGGKLLSEFAGNGSVDGMQSLLDLGVGVDALYETGDGYFGVAPRSTALHVAAWRAQHAAIKLLISRRAAVNARDGNGQTPLMLAVKACVDSFWAYRRSPESIEALLAAGASPAGIDLPSGYAEADALLVKADR